MFHAFSYSSTGLGLEAISDKNENILSDSLRCDGYSWAKFIDVI